MALAGILSGCGQGNVGGGGIEIPNGLHVTVTSTGGTALRGVKVRLLARDAWTTLTQAGLPVALDSATTDSAGNVNFRILSNQGVWVEAVSGGLGQRIQVDSSSQVSLALAPLSSLTGDLGGSGPSSGVAIRLGGSDRSTVTDASGAFHFDSLPQGTWNLVAQPGRALAPLKTVDLGPTPLTVQGLNDDTSSVLLEDFSNGTDIWNLEGLFGSGFWWINSAGDPTQVFGVAGAWQSVTGDASGNHWISFTVNAANMPVNPWASAGMDFGPQGGILPELSGLNAVQIQCQGTGSWKVSLVEQLSDTTQSWTVALPLSSTWSTLNISTSSLAGPAGQTWALAPRRVRQIYFQTTGSGALDVRSLTLLGASLSNWSR